MTRTYIRLSMPLVLAAVLALSATSSTAQTKIAYLDASKLLKRMPEAKDAESRMTQLVGSWTKEASDMQGEIDRKQGDFDRRKLIMTDAERNASQLELETLRKRLDDFRHQKFDENGGELFTQQQQLMKPAYDKLQKAIIDVAGDLGFDYVLDRSSRDVVLLYTNSKYDLTLAVARKLGIENELVNAPLVNPNPKQPNQPVKPHNPNQPPTQPPPTPGVIKATPNQPGFNSGTYNPGQIPPPPQTEKH